MNNQFDERIASRIRDVFDNYEDSSVDYGWQELRKKYPAKRDRRLLVYWLSSAAAILFLGLGVWILTPKHQEEEANLAKVSSPSKKHPQSGEKQDANLLNNDLASSNNSRNKVSVTPEDINKTRILSNTKTDELASNFVKKRKEKGAVRNESSFDALIGDSISTNYSSNKKEEIEKLIAAADIITVKAISDSATFVTSATTDQSVTSLAQNGPEERKKSLLDIAFEEENSKSKKTAKKLTEKKITFGVYAGSFINYAAGSDNKVNLGAGLSSDIALTKNLKLSTGISLTQNSLSFQNSIPSAARTSFNTSFNSPISPASGENRKLLRPISYNLDKYEASLLGVDIPLNLKYSFLQKDNEFFLSAGLSSGTFLNESYTYHYNSTGPGGDIRLPESEGGISPVLYENKQEKTLGNFDFGRMFNFSFGLGYPLGKQNRLIVEPFLKYPLKPVGAENLRFGSGGINLKLNFQSFKK